MSCRLLEALDDLDHNRHDHTCPHVLALLRYGVDGEPGVKAALRQLQKAFVDAVTADGSRTKRAAGAEFKRMVRGERAAKIFNNVRVEDVTDNAEAVFGAGPKKTKSKGENVTNAKTKASAAALFDQRAVTGDWLDGQKFAPLDYAVDGLVPEGLGVLAGPPKKGKSFLVADIGLAVASGGKALRELATVQRPVLYLVLEDGHRRLRSRFRRILPGKHIPAGIQVITSASSDESLVLIEEFFAPARRRETVGHRGHARQDQAPQRSRERTPTRPTTRSAPP